MKRFALGLLVAAIYLPATAILAQEDAASSDDTATKSPAKRYQSLVDEYQSAYTKWLTAARAASQAGKAVDMSSQPNQQEYAAKFKKLAEEHPADPVAADALFWIARTVTRGSEGEEALATLFNKYPESKHIGTACRLLGQRISQTADETLRKVMKSHPDVAVRGQASFALAQMYKQLSSLAPMLKDEERVELFKQYYGQEFIDFVNSKNPDEVKVEVEKLFEMVAAEFSDIEFGRGTLGELVARELYEIRNLSVGCEVPEIEAEDIDGVEFKLSDYRGKVVLLDFWGDW
jgi:hypothetical protein